MSFSFGAKPAFGASTSFGAPQTNLSFGATPTTQAQPQSSLFGTPTAQPGGGLSFGTPAATPASNLFGTNTTFGAPPSNLSFGAPAAGAAPTFGAPAAGAAPTFGAPTASAAPTFAAPTFGAPTASAAPTFGAPIASAAPSFGATPAPTFGAPTASATPTFGAPAASAAPSFGATPAPAFGAATPGSTSFSFGSNPAPNLSFGAPPATTKPALSFGTPAATSAPTGLSFGGPSTGFSLGGTTPAFGGTTSAGGTGLSFGTPASQTPGFGLGTSTTASTGGLFAGFGAPSTSTSIAITTAAPAPIGLGGVATTTPTSTTLVTKTEQAPKEQNLPNEIQQTVDSFKNFVKQQKTYSSDVARCSIKEFRKVESDINAVNSLLNELEKQLATNKNIAEKLKYDTARGLQQVEMAQRTYDTPLGLQYENTAPLNFFLELADNFERELQNMKLQIENTDKYVRNIGKPAPLSSQDLAVGMRRIHETFVALAGRLQSVHSQVEAQKEQYLNFRKHMLNDSANVFETDNKESEIINLAIHSIRIELPKIATGPTPFNSVSHPSVVQAVAQNTPPPAYGSTNTFGSFSSNLGGTSSLFGNTTFGQPFGSATTQSGFHLQKPPTGNKRGKP